MHRITFLIVFSFLANFASAQALTDSTIAMIAFWSPEEEYTYQFKETENKKSKGEVSLKTMTYDLHMTVLDSTADHYILQWTYDNYQLNYTMQPYEKELLEIMQNIPIQYRTNAFGKFENILNWELMSANAEKAFDLWLTQKESIPDSISTPLKQMTMALFESEAQMKYWARDLRFFHYLYGANLYRDRPMKGTKFYTNPFIKKNMPGNETVEVVAVDEENWIAEINVQSGIDGEASRELVYDFLLNNMENFGITDKSEIKKEEIPGFTVTEKLNCIYHIPSGVIIKGEYSKRTEVGQDYKDTTYTFELTE